MPTEINTDQSKLADWYSSVALILCKGFNSATTEQYKDKPQELVKDIADEFALLLVDGDKKFDKDKFMEHITR